MDTQQDLYIVCCPLLPFQKIYSSCYNPCTFILWFPTEKLKAIDFNSTKKGKPSDHQDPALVVTESLHIPPGQRLIPARQESTSGLHLRASAVACFVWETDLGHVQK